MRLNATLRENFAATVAVAFRAIDVPVDKVPCPSMGGFAAWLAHYSSWWRGRYPEILASYASTSNWKRTS